MALLDCSSRGAFLVVFENLVDALFPSEGRRLHHFDPVLRVAWAHKTSILRNQPKARNAAEEKFEILQCQSSLPVRTYLRLQSAHDVDHIFWIDEKVVQRVKNSLPAGQDDARGRAPRRKGSFVVPEEQPPFRLYVPLASHVERESWDRHAVLPLRFKP